MLLHSSIVLVWYLRVNGLKREWWIDLPELTSIRLGWGAFEFICDDDSSELIMRSDDDEMKWWIDLPKLTTLTGVYCTFRYPRIITLEGISYHSTLTNRHALSHHCHSYHGMCFLREENHSYEEFLFLPYLIPRHHSRSPAVYPVDCFFHTHHSHPNTKSPFSLHTAIPPFLPLFHSFCGILCHAIKHSFTPRLLFHSNCKDQSIHTLW